MYEATDILDLCKLNAAEQQEPSSNLNFGCLNPVVIWMQNLIVTHDIGSRMKELNQRLDVICESGSKFNFIRMEDNQGSRLVRPPTDSKTSPVKEQSGLVGMKIEEDTKDLLDMLTKGRGSSRAEGNMMVLAIAGIGGIGKTTLAQNIYNHPTIEEKFDQKLWLSVTQNFTVAELLRVAVTQAGGQHHHANERSLLEPTLLNLIRDKKIFVVLDDLWRVGAVECNNMIKASFSYAARGSCVLVTTRHDGVARVMNARCLHRMDFLGHEDAWSLLKKQPQRESLEVDNLKDIGFEILDRCGGLPLAIKVIGGLLRQRDMNIVEWERVLNNPVWSTVGLPEDLSYAVYLSYEDLPPYLKQCLLYYSFVYGNVHIDRDSLVEMWIGEGLVSCSSSDNLEELGADYYEELIMRNLIEIDNRYMDKPHCRMHDVVLSFCQYMARDEALIVQKGETDIGSRLHSQEFRVLSISVDSESDEFEWSVLQKQDSLRTLILFGPIKFKPGDSLSRLSHLRTLSMHGADFRPMVDYLSELRHLRFLTIACSELSSLPDNIGQMKFLLHISLLHCKKMVRLPNGIVKLKQLRFLSLEGSNINSVPCGFAALTNSRTLLDFPAHMDSDSNSWCSLEELGPLSKLTNLELKGLENVYPSSLATKAMLCTKKHLVNLKLTSCSRLGDDIPEEDQQHIEEVFDELCPPACINNLTIHEYFGR
ncbi:hypothetical protein ACP4OV_026883 [Aristida adscensionis]